MVTKAQIESLLTGTEFRPCGEVGKCADDKTFYSEIESWSPLGENIVETVFIDGTANGFIEGLYQVYEDFDPDDHAAMWVGIRGTNGCPDSVIGLAQDALDIEKMLDALWQTAKKNYQLVIHFADAKEMNDLITGGTDLYCPSEELYAFVYNDEGSICYYGIGQYEAVELQKEAARDEEYWGAYLGVGGHICDTPEYLMENGYTNPEEHYKAMDFCEDYYDREWIKTSDVIEYFEGGI